MPASVTVCPWVLYHLGLDVNNDCKCNSVSLVLYHVGLEVNNACKCNSVSLGVISRRPRSEQCLQV
jgi:hypothetical protein